jgi:hypothetical protein
VTAVEETLKARDALDAAIREQLREAWERGLATAPHGVNALADQFASNAFSCIEWHVDDYVAALARLHGEGGKAAGCCEHCRDADCPPEGHAKPCNFGCNDEAPAVTS